MTIKKWIEIKQLIHNKSLVYTTHRKDLATQSQSRPSGSPIHRGGIVLRVRGDWRPSRHEGRDRRRIARDWSGLAAKHQTRSRSTCKQNKTFSELVPRLYDRTERKLLSVHKTLLHTLLALSRKQSSALRLCRQGCRVCTCLYLSVPVCTCLYMYLPPVAVPHPKTTLTAPPRKKQKLLISIPWFMPCHWFACKFSPRPQSIFPLVTFFYFHCKKHYC